MTDKLPPPDEWFTQEWADPDSPEFDAEKTITWGLSLKALGAELTDEHEGLLMFAGVVLIAQQLVDAGVSPDVALRRLTEEAPTLEMSLDDGDLRVSAVWLDDEGNVKPGNSVRVVENENGDRDFEVEIGGPKVRFSIRDDD